MINSTKSDSKSVASKPTGSRCIDAVRLLTPDDDDVVEQLTPHDLQRDWLYDAAHSNAAQQTQDSQQHSNETNR